MKIGVFDSGLGGLSILTEIRRLLPEYDYLYIGDNARAPYGTRSFDVIYEYTWQAVQYLIAQDCRLIILACNTASAKALRNIQQRNIDPEKVRVLGVIRPTVEAVSGSKHIGILATPGTVNSESYVIELSKIDPDICVSQQSCPMWVPLIENGEKDSPAMDYFIDKYLSALLRQDPEISTILLGCTHYPLIEQKIRQYLINHAQQFASQGPESALPPRIVSQGRLVAESLKDYLCRHTEIECQLSRGGSCLYQTTESANKFADSASMFVGAPINAEHVEL